MARLDCTASQYACAAGFTATLLAAPRLREDLANRQWLT
jgi:hypothetical protein